MANLVGIQDQVDGERNLVVRIDIEGDGSSATESITVAETALKNCTEFRLDRVTGRLEGFVASLEWEGTSPVTFLRIPDDDQIDWNYRSVGGLVNPKIAGYTGDVKLNIAGLAVGGVGSLLLHFIKKRIDPVIP